MSLPVMQNDIFQADDASSATWVPGKTKVASLRHMTAPFATMSTQERSRLLTDHQEKLKTQNAEDLEDDAFNSEDGRV